MTTSTSPMRFFWDFTYWVEEITDRDEQHEILLTFCGIKPDQRYGIGEVMYSIASGNVFVSPA